MRRGSGGVDDEQHLLHHGGSRRWNNNKSLYITEGAMEEHSQGMQAGWVYDRCHIKSDECSMQSLVAHVVLLCQYCPRKWRGLEDTTSLHNYDMKWSPLVECMCAQSASPRRATSQQYKTYAAQRHRGRTSHVVIT